MVVTRVRHEGVLSSAMRRSCAGTGVGDMVVTRVRSGIRVRALQGMVRIKRSACTILDPRL